MLGVEMVATRPKVTRPREGRKDLLRSFIRLPVYLWNDVGAYAERQENMSIKNVLMAGLRALGMDIDDEDLTTRKRRPIKHYDDTVDSMSQVSTTLQLPRYVWDQVESYVMAEKISKRHVFIRGLKALDFPVREEDDKSLGRLIREGR
ncbi:hypothetical protein CFR80_15155 [Komagataeibacter oboediens]|uniref:Uncharacterized protein n=1 Tax=Komagataeibacter oboediens TaxID=65958 RepID=A0A318QW43_9PROT|nr:hypothetical protein [Komagataeibacter oboediens]PYD79379.1 hypothetical protein CFR80_15155 [Komagataeibacter oboediens]